MPVCLGVVLAAYVVEGSRKRVSTGGRSRGRRPLPGAAARLGLGLLAVLISICITLVPTALAESRMNEPCFDLR